LNHAPFYVDAMSPQNPRAAVIFDLDELLIDSKPIWRAAEEKVFIAMGREYSLDVARSYKGRNSFDVAATLYRLFHPPGSLRTYQDLMRSSLVAEYARADIIAMPGAVDLVRRLDGLVPLAVASGSPREGIDKALERMGIRPCFKTVISSESVANGKPAPDVFLKAAEILGADPAQCLVFEDSLHGVQAALAAGMKVFAVPSIGPQLIAPLATRVFGTLGDVATDDVMSVLIG
jgi:HAD superfamily hydrolase (TIGR01509 family)